jgi:uncharacterized protein (DUF58 family)
MTAERCVEARLHWRPSPLLLAVATCAGAALALAVIESRFQLIAFAAPLLGVLCSISWQRPPSAVYVHARPDLVRVFETEPTEVSVWLTTEVPDMAAEHRIAAVAGMTVQTVEESGEQGPGQLRRVTVSAQRWGRYAVPVEVRVVADGGLLVGTATVDTAAIFVFPIAPPQATAIPRTDLPDRLGTHLTAHLGPGVEYADIRSYLPGDQLRTVNWPVSARRGRLFVTQRLTDRAADVVVLLDTSEQAPGPATEAVERTVRGATQVVQSALRNGDRTGVITLGGHRPRWLSADIGRRQFYRILDAMLCAGAEFETTTGTLAPPPAVPPGAIVVAFSTLLDTSLSLALIELRQRGHTVVAVDVLGRAPFADEQDPIVTRMWALQRHAMYRDMGVAGVEVVAWPEEANLDQAMRLLPQHRNTARRR